MEVPSASYSKKYFDRWSYLLTGSPFKGYYRYIAARYESEFAKYGYSLIKGFVQNEEALGSGSEVSAILGPVYCRAADLGAVLRRCAVRTKGYLRRLIRRSLPGFVLSRIRRARQNALLTEQGAHASP